MAQNTAHIQLNNKVALNMSKLTHHSVQNKNDLNTKLGTVKGGDSKTSILRQFLRQFCK